MGFLDGITQESKRNFIARPDAAKEDIIYLYPEHNIRLMTQLTLMPEEVAIFINEGKAQGKLGPGGTHVLDTKNVPFISRLLEKLTGGNLFIAQLFFITTGKPFVGIKFGGSIGALRDPVNDYTVAGMVFGSFQVQVTNPDTLLSKTGTGTGDFARNKFLEPFKQTVLDGLSSAITAAGSAHNWSLADMVSGKAKEPMKKSMLEFVEPYATEWGIKVLRFENFVINYEESEQYKKLNEMNTKVAMEKRRMEMAQNPAFMAQAQVGLVEGAAEGFKKGGEGAGMGMGGIGMGMGLQMAQMFGQQMAHPQAPALQQAQNVKCPSCGQLSVPGKFCNQCGKALSPPTGKCECGADLVAGAKFCAICGKVVSEGPRKCECGADLVPGAKFCANCGKPA
jgi:membrane protease subunit (stomatin/prohibitin family)